jgi:virulence factor Mce-like protein
MRLFRKRPQRPINPERRGWRGGMHPFWVGLIAGGLAIFVFYLAYSGWNPMDPLGSPGRLLKVQVASGQGLLLKRSPVRFAGVDVGYVTAIDRGPEGTAIISTKLEDNAPPVHADAAAKVRPRTFLEGNYFIDLQPGSPSAPPMADGGTIPIARTSIPVQFDQVVSIFTRDSREQLRTGLRQLGNAFGPDAIKSFNKAQPHFAPGFRYLATAARSFRGTQPHDMSEGIRAVAETNAAIASNLPALDSVVRSFSTVAAALADEQDSLGATIGELANVIRATRPSLSAVDDAIPETRDLIAAARPVLRETPPVVNRSMPFVKQANRLLRPRNLPELTRRLSPAVRTLASFAPDGAATFRELQPIVRCVNDAVVPTLFKEIDDGVLTSGEPVYRELFSSFLGLASASQNFDGNGFEARFHSGFGDNLLQTRIPSVGETLFASAEEPILGSTPELPDEQPPFLDEKSCVGTPAPDLASDVGPPGFVPASKGSTTLDGRTPSQRQLQNAFDSLTQDVEDLKRLKTPLDLKRVLR